MPPKPVPIEERFQRYVGQPLPNGCIPWTGATNGPRGYGRIGTGVGTSGKYAHRLSYEMAHGPIPDGLDVRHKCDHPWCVNPEHLEVGTRKENMADAMARGRVPLGLARAHTKLSPELVMEVRRRVASGEMQSVVADELGLSRQNVCDIVHMKRWKHLAASTAALKSGAA